MRPQRFQFGGSDHFDRPGEKAEPCSCRIKRVAVGFFVFECVFKTEDLDIDHSMTISLKCPLPVPRDRTCGIEEEKVSRLIILGDGILTSAYTAG